ncbi:hypothetical protein BAUCODRAFT_30718 [Baudoinia panamericana UAMH 10762]|uniref:Uncharacterized protein n=1 Tax=Baudoinia panamericana (strain UAMH 10762) TaxID=717646 RepID=M2NL92_BAUPA|nr:uncharacterized protein BAUCODRAFT_30718 [Baudoinia panamericana UAMH 10762]EMD00245.1 hypothetical protein BAUCODRAFT_30718 [Baudoinia panamericana UAMH 10762]
MLFDEGSGLVYSERLGSPCDCLRRFLRSAPGQHGRLRTRSPHGARKLYDMSTTRLLLKLANLDASCLVGVPPHLLDTLWTLIEHEKRDSLAVWKVFAQSAITSLKVRTREVTYTCTSCRNLGGLLSLVTSPQTHWMTDITLDGKTLEPTDVVLLADLHNVRQITVRSWTPCLVTDRILRSWSEAATNRGAFSMLECLTLRTCPRRQCEDLSTYALDHLHSFPKLDEVCIETCNNKLSTGAKVWATCNGFVRESDFVTRGSTSHIPVVHVRIGLSVVIHRNNQFNKTILKKSSNDRPPTKHKISSTNDYAPERKSRKVTKSKTLAETLAGLDAL